MRGQLEIRIAYVNRDLCHMWAALGVGFAAEALAIAAILAGAELCSIWIGVRLRRVRRRTRERVIARVARGLAKHLARENGRKRRQCVFALTRRLERIAA